MNLPYEELRALLILNLLGQKKFILDSFSQGKRPSEILPQIDRAESKVFADQFNPDREVEECQKKGIRLLTWFDPDYPALLREIHDPSLLLYRKGNILDCDKAAVAIVGTRHPSLYGLTQTKRFARTLASSGFTIVSGFAKGIDQSAHEACLEISHGRTIAVLGCGADVDYPKGSAKLYAAIAEKGAVISEYPLGTPPRSENFPKRNRIISGLSLGVLVVEAHSRSGSLITAHEALDQGRDIFAIPGPIDQLTSHGTHRLIKEGALLVESPEEIIEAAGCSMLMQQEVKESFTQQPPEGQQTFSDNQPSQPAIQQLLPPPASQEEEILIKILSSQPLAYEEIMRESSLLPQQATALLTELELKAKIRKNPDGRFALI